MNRKLLSKAGALVVLAAFAHGAYAQKCEVNRPVVFADLNWASNAFHMAVAERIVSTGYGCQTASKPGTTVPLLGALASGDVDVMMELWESNAGGKWRTLIAEGQIVDLGTNYNDAVQGWYVPRFLVEGPDAKAPGLKKVTDLPKYKHLFEDPDDPSKGRFYNCVKGWLCEKINTKKLDQYRLSEHFTNHRPSSSASLVAAIIKAHKLKTPILTYYWQPTWMMGKYDMVRLDVGYPTSDVRVGVNGRFKRAAPKLSKFLQRYETDSDTIGDALAYIQDHSGATPDDAAVHFLKTQESTWTQWVPSDVADRVRQSL